MEPLGTNGSKSTLRAKFNWKIPLGKWFFKLLPKLKWRETKIGYLAAILKRKAYFLFFLFVDFLLEYGYI